MRLPFIPREEKFFALFTDDAANMLAAARLLEQFFRNYAERERLGIQLRDVDSKILAELTLPGDPSSLSS